LEGLAVLLLARSFGSFRGAVLNEGESFADAVFVLISAQMDLMKSD